MNAQQNNNTAGETKTRCAIYARCVFADHAETTVKNQINECRSYAERQSWSVAEQFVLADIGVSGNILCERHALQALTEAAEHRPRPFDRLLIADTARLARHPGLAFKVVKQMAINDVHVVDVSRSLDLSEASSRYLLVLSDILDEQHINRLAQEIYRARVQRRAEVPR
jgi:DNA invertase Pin-like site-specific DNA recombinase